MVAVTANLMTWLGTAGRGEVGYGKARVFTYESNKMIPIDTQKIKVGDTISQQQCEEVIGYPEASNPKDFQFALLQLLGIVQKQLRKEHGRELTVRIVGSELYVLTDQEAAEYNPKRFDAGLRLARRAHRRLMAVNVAKLSATERESHMRTIGNQAHKLSMLRKKEQIPLPATERTTPVMVFAERKK